MSEKNQEAAIKDIEEELLAVPLVECAVLPPDVVGGKARALGRMMAADLPVLDGICLTTALFRHVRTATALEETIAAGLQGLQQRPIMSARILHQIRTAIMDTPLPVRALSTIESAVRPILASGPVIVRSSTPTEDSLQTSHAGIFLSSRGVHEPAAAIEAVRACWASLFTERTLFYGRGELIGDMAVVLQPYLEPDLSGVMFTRDPLTGAEQYLIEVDEEGTNSITGGRAASHTIRLKKESPHTSDLPPFLLKSLLESAHHIEQLFDGAVDIEWAWQDGALRIWQARRITGGRRDISIETTWARQEDIEDVYNLELGKCTRLFTRQLQKKVWLRQYCQAQKIKTYALRYLVYDEPGLIAKFAALRGEIEMPYVRVHWGNDSRLTSADNLAEVLLAGRPFNPVGDGSFSCAQVGDVVPGEVTGFSTCLPDGTILIEAFPSGLEGIKDGAVPATTFVVTSEGELLRKVGARYHRRGSLSLTSEGWQEAETSEYTIELTAQEVSRAAAITRSLARAFGEVRAEWYLYQNDIYVRDISIETDPIALTTDRIQLSSGTASGAVILLGSMDKFDDAAEHYGISVVSHGGSQDDVYHDAVVTKVRDLKAKMGSLVAVAEYPSIGLIPLLSYVSGFVFTRGTMLCHTAIVLRERGIPALIVPTALAHVKEGDHVSISVDGLTVVTRAASQ